GRAGGLRGQRREDQDAGAQERAQVQRDRGARRESPGHGRSVAPVAGQVVTDRARLAVRCAIICLVATEEETIMPLDATDRRMLEILQREGRIANAALAERLHLSPSPCLRRLRALER